jgi:hypothetical protein
MGSIDYAYLLTWTFMADQGSTNRPGDAHPLSYASNLERRTAGPTKRAAAIASIVIGLFPILCVLAEIRDDGDPMPFFLYAMLICASVCVLLGLIIGLAAFFGARKSLDLPTKRLALIGILLALFWPVFVVGAFGADELERRGRQKQYVVRIQQLDANAALDWIREFNKNGVAPDAIDMVYPQTYLYFGKGIKKSTAFDRVAPQLVVISSDNFQEGDFGGPNGEIFVFADGNLKFVPRDELDAVIASDEAARASLGLPSSRRQLEWMGER